jgi:hypothetical protein
MPFMMENSNKICDKNVTFIAQKTRQKNPAKLMPNEVSYYSRYESAVKLRNIFLLNAIL